MIYPEDLSAGLSAIGLNRLQSGEVDDDFYGITRELISTGSQPAITEGRLLKVGGDLHNQNPDLRSALVNLALAQSLYFEYGSLRPIGHQILNHLIFFPSYDDDLTLRLTTLRELSQIPESTN